MEYVNVRSIATVNTAYVVCLIHIVPDQPRITHCYNFYSVSIQTQSDGQDAREEPFTCGCPAMQHLKMLPNAWNTFNPLCV